MELLARLAEDPRGAATLFDVDGVLAPIVPRPEDARVPDDTRAELRRLHERYALVACVSGRSGQDARRVVGVPELIYVGNHGLELAHGAEEWRGPLRSLLDQVDWPALEDKGLTASLHYRGAGDEDAARAELETIAEQARAIGLRARFGRKVLELLPPVDADKGTAVRALLEQSGTSRALYAGDDTTDLDGFAALDGLEAAVRIAIVSPEGPAELGERADLVLGSTDAFAELLGRL
jgi:trehalose 6-phosphate phosphatase